MVNLTILMYEKILIITSLNVSDKLINDEKLLFQCVFQVDTLRFQVFSIN